MIHISTVQVKVMQVLPLKLFLPGLAAASAARILGRKATICVTQNTPSNILERLKAEGAEVRQTGYYWSDADDLCRQLVKMDPNGV
jgi:threonine dehydratase